MPVELYVYYRAPVSAAAAVCRAVAGMQDRLTREEPGLSARLLRRPEAREDLHTWMEVYAGGALATVEDGESIAQRIEAAAAVALAGSIVGPRHVEVFVPVAGE